jgi:hypothetical protein
LAFELHVIEAPLQVKTPNRLVVLAMLEFL